MEKLTNLWEETVSFLATYNKSWEDDVIAVCGSNFTIPKELFEKLAKETNYYRGYGHQIVAYDLVIAGTDWWLQRWEYDGSEGWEYFTTFTPPEVVRDDITKLADDECVLHWWGSLASINGEEEEEE